MNSHDKARNPTLKFEKFANMEKEKVQGMEVQQKDITEAAKRLGIKSGDIVLIHSSFKSLGLVAGGAETVVSGFLKAIGAEGTLVFPTLCQKEFATAHETWHLDKESDVGYLTNYFRKRAGSVRSDQATHSVAASGYLAQELTRTHGHTHKRFGNMGDTPFSADSPWAKMYAWNAKVVLLGVGPRALTFRHFAEYVYIEKMLQTLREKDLDITKKEAMKEKLSCMEHTGVWPHVDSIWAVEQLEQAGQISRTNCGNAELICVSAKVFVDFVLQCLFDKVDNILWHNDPWWSVEEWQQWRLEVER